MTAGVNLKFLLCPLIILDPGIEPVLIDLLDRAQPASQAPKLIEAADLEFSQPCESTIVER